MPEKILFTKSAEEDLDCIKKYIYDDNIKAAKEVVVHILSSIEKLLITPNIGRAGRVLRTRELVITKYPYIVPYQVRNNIVYILRVLHTSRKWE
ncbi:MAG: type II toxin-antitoxin system RelE/ParE family toxin [Candidatus Gastranaerophilales bacterium]|nr:type II toxin-antitoxin system RelE/ParE family toxin [Candidatus Gastranaerophilales bacterium]